MDKIPQHAVRFTSFTTGAQATERCVSLMLCCRFTRQDIEQASTPSSHSIVRPSAHWGSWVHVWERVQRKKIKYVVTGSVWYIPKRS